MGALLNYNIRATNGFVVAAGAILGVCAGLLWTAQGSLVLAYATEGQKGRLFSVFWIVFNMGGTIGSAIETGLSWNSTSNTVSNAVYVVFLVIAAVGALIPVLLVNPATMVRNDGTRVIPPIHPSASSLPLLEPPRKPELLILDLACSLEDRVPRHVAAPQEGDDRPFALPALLLLKVRPFFLVRV